MTRMYVWALVLAAVVAASLALVETADAAVPPTYTNDNYWQAEHDRPVTFWQDSLGNFYGTTETGKQFSQVAVANDLGIRLQKFSIDEAFFYVSDKGTIRAESDLKALSIYLSRTV